MNIPRWVSYVPVTLAVGIAFTLSIVNSQLHPERELFSTDSLKSLKTLNTQYQMTVEDLSNTSEESPLLTELFQADALITTQEASRTNKGLVVSLENEELLLLQPVESLTDVELTQIAEAYESTVPEFTHVELDQEVTLESPVYDWTLDSAIPSTNVQLSSDTVREIRVGIIDSGMDTSHSLFDTIAVEDGWNTISDDQEMYDDVGHGTHIGGIVAVQAPEATLVPYKIVDAQGGKLSNVLEAFSKAIDDEVDVINTSFGLSSSSFALETLINEAYDEGIIVVSAAGNSGKDTGFYPAGYAQTIAVAGVDAGGHKMPNSNYGTWVDVAAYGYHVRSALPNDRYGYKSGTSQATAFVSAAVARLLMSSETTLDFESVMNALEESPESILDGELAGTPIVE